MVPHEVIQHPLRHSFGSEVSSVQLLVAPFYPASLSAYAVDEAERGHFAGIVQREAG